MGGEGEGSGIPKLAGSERKNYAALHNISQSKKRKEAEANSPNTGREPGLKGTGSGKLNPLPPLFNTAL